MAARAKQRFADRTGAGGRASPLNILGQTYVGESVKFDERLRYPAGWKTFDFSGPMQTAWGSSGISETVLPNLAYSVRPANADSWWVMRQVANFTIVFVRRA